MKAIQDNFPSLICCGFRCAIPILLLVSAAGMAEGQGRPALECASGTVASYLGTSCSQYSVVYHWLSYSCTSTPSSICEALGTNGSNVTIKTTPNDPGTLFVMANESRWNVTAGQNVDVVIRGTVYNATINHNWPHFDHHLAGQTGDGTGEYITTVGCGANCRNANKGASDILCSSTSPVANCTDQASMAPYAGALATFNPATSASPYSLTIEVKLDGGKNGTASLRSVGTHLGYCCPPESRH